MTKALLTFLIESYAHHRAPLRFPHAPPIGRGIGLAFGLFAMQGTWGYIGTDWSFLTRYFAELGSLCRNQARQYGMEVGVLTRSAVCELAGTPHHSGL